MAKKNKIAGPGPENDPLHFGRGRGAAGLGGPGGPMAAA